MSRGKDSGKLLCMKLSFPLLLTGVPARLALHSRAPLNFRDYVLKINFPGIEANRELAETLKLPYSDGLASLFLYNLEQDGGIVHSDFFRLPRGAQSMDIEIVEWGRKGEPILINGVDLQVEAPWSRFNRLTQIGVVTNV